MNLDVRHVRLVLGAATVALAGCSPRVGRLPAFRYRADLPPATYFPLALGTVWGYRAEFASGAPDLLVVSRVVERDGPRAVLATGADPLAYEDRGDAIVRLPSGTVALRSPLARGAFWPIPGGTATILAVDAVVDVPAGHFTGGLVVEERTSERRLRTTYVPRVGPALQEIYAIRPGGGESWVSRARLQGFHGGGEANAPVGAQLP